MALGRILENELADDDCWRRVRAIAWLVEIAGDQPAGPWERWPLHKRVLQRNLVVHRRRLQAFAQQGAQLAELASSIDGHLRHLNLRRGPTPWMTATVGGQSYGSSRAGDFDLADPPPRLATLAGKALALLPEPFVRALARVAPRPEASRRGPTAFGSCWAIAAWKCIECGHVGELTPPYRPVAAAAGMALAAVVADLDRRKWHDQNLDRVLRQFSDAPGVDEADAKLARRLSDLEITARDQVVHRLLARRFRALEDSLPLPAPTLQERIDRLTGGLKKVAILLRDRSPGICSDADIQRMYGGTTKSTTIAGMLRHRAGIQVERHSVAARRDRSLKNLPAGYRIPPEEL